jgi:two-component system cell cycle response regulator CpdR
MAYILVAEDDPSMRNFLKMALEKAEPGVITAHDGLDALEILKKSIQSEQPFDLLLTDIVMPGMDGIELSRRATDLNKDMKVMFITGFAAVAMDAKQSEAPSAKVLSKPFHLNDLVSQVETVLKAA